MVGSKENSERQSWQLFSVGLQTLVSFQVQSVTQPTLPEQRLIRLNLIIAPTFIHGCWGRRPQNLITLLWDFSNTLCNKLILLVFWLGFFFFVHVTSETLESARVSAALSLWVGDENEWERRLRSDAFLSSSEGVEGRGRRERWGAVREHLSPERRRWFHQLWDQHGDPWI